MGITEEQWGKFARYLFNKYFSKDKQAREFKGTKALIISKDVFAGEVAELFGGYSSWRVSEMKKSGSLYGFLFRYNDNHYAIQLEPTKKS